MKAYYVVSSNINCLGYQRGRLFVRFNSGQTYSYDKVPFPVFRTLKESDSVGNAFHRLVRGHYPYQKLEQDPFGDTPNPLKGMGIPATKFKAAH